MRVLMETERSGQKRRLHIVLSLDNPRHRETWQILSQEKNKTSAICEAVCGYHKRKDLKDTLREVLQEELKHVSVPLDVKDDERQDLAMDAGVLDFLQALQNE